MFIFTRTEKLAVYYRLLAVLILVLIAVLFFLLPNKGKRPQTPSDTEKTTNPAQTEAQTEPVTEPQTEPVTEPQTEPETEPETKPQVTIDDSFFDNALFIGESRIAGLYYSGILSNADYLFASNNTIGDALDGTFSLNDGDDLYVEDALDAGEYDSVYLMFGMNELGWTSDDSFLSYYEDLVSLIRDRLPDATVYIQSVVYVTENYEADVSWIENSHVDTFNSLLQSICDGEHVVYLDVNTALTSDGYLDSDNSTNGFQFSYDHMEVWVEALKEQLSNLQ